MGRGDRDLTLPALLLFLIVFFWTPPHFWALALLIRREYAAARIPMLPVVRGEPETTRRSSATRSFSSPSRSSPSSPAPPGWLYLGIAVGLGAVFLGLALVLARQTTPAHARRLFTLLARLPGAALRRPGRRPAGGVLMDPGLARRNIRLGLALFAFALVLFGGSIAVAFIYRAAE